MVGCFDGMIGTCPWTGEQKRCGFQRKISYCARQAKIAGDVMGKNGLECRFCLYLGKPEQINLHEPQFSHLNNGISLYREGLSRIKHKR